VGITMPHLQILSKCMNKQTSHLHRSLTDVSP
jgi:hypothetical protein